MSQVFRAREKASTAACSGPFSCGQHRLLPPSPLARTRSSEDVGLGGSCKDNFLWSAGPASKGEPRQSQRRHLAMPRRTRSLRCSQFLVRRLHVRLQRLIQNSKRSSDSESTFRHRFRCAAQRLPLKKCKVYPSLVGDTGSCKWHRPCLQGTARSLALLSSGVPISTRSSAASSRAPSATPFSRPTRSFLESHVRRVARSSIASASQSGLRQVLTRHVLCAVSLSGNSDSEA